MKNTQFNEGSKSSHLAYIVDAVVGKSVNIGCGVITVNYDGQVKAITNIGDDVFVGCNSNLIAPVNINSNTYIGAGTTITKEVPEYALAIGRSRQENKENYLKNKKQGEK
jgi:bifunctional UDP-N-acetylglucosamine pyrophosphorylase/glucosamine-1-phosphate N-acetyltransferase